MQIKFLKEKLFKGTGLIQSVVVAIATVSLIVFYLAEFGKNNGYFASADAENPCAPKTCSDAGTGPGSDSLCWTWAGDGCGWQGSSFAGSCVCTRTTQPSPPPGGGFTPRSAEKVCQDFGGGKTNSCSADPNCGRNGGVCCDKGGTNYCCYRDSQTRQDGACYGGGNSGVFCNGNTITNNTGSGVTIKFFKGNEIDNCPISTPSNKPDTNLAPGASINADNCEQIEAVGFCGVCNNNNCGGKVTNPECKYDKVGMEIIPGNPTNGGKITFRAYYADMNFKHGDFDYHDTFTPSGGIISCAGESVNFNPDFYRWTCTVNTTGTLQWTHEWAANEAKNIRCQKTISTNIQTVPTLTPTPTVPVSTTTPTRRPTLTPTPTRRVTLTPTKTPTPTPTGIIISCGDRCISNWNGNPQSQGECPASAPTCYAYSSSEWRCVINPSWSNNGCLPPGVTPTLTPVPTTTPIILRCADNCDPNNNRCPDESHYCIDYANDNRGHICGKSYNQADGPKCEPQPLRCADNCDSNNNRCPGEAPYCIDYTNDNRGYLCGKTYLASEGPKCEDPALRCADNCDPNNNKCPADARYCVDYSNDGRQAICGRQSLAGKGSQCETTYIKPVKPPILGISVPNEIPKTGLSSDLTKGLLEIGIVGVIIRAALLFI